MRTFQHDPGDADSQPRQSWGPPGAVDGTEWLRLTTVIVPRGSRPGGNAPAAHAQDTACGAQAPACRFWSLDEALAAYARVHDAM